MSPIQERILSRLPATPKELAQELYGAAGSAELAAVHVHIHHLRRHVEILSTARDPDFYDDDRSRVVYTL